MRGGEHDPRLRCHQVLQLLGERGNGAVKAQRGPRGQFDFAERRVLVEHVYRAELIEIEAHVRVERCRKNFGAQVDIFGPDERADAGALMALLDLVPPAIDLVAHHRRLVDEERAARNEREQRTLRAGNGSEKLPSRKDADAAGRRGFGGHLFVFNSMRCRLRRPFTAASRRSVTGVSVSGSNCVSSRPHCERCVSGIEFADGLNFVAEELDAHGAVGLGRVDVENSAAARELAGHLHEIHLRVADAGKVRGEHFDVDLFAALERDGEAGVVPEIEELQRRGFDGSDEDIDGAGGELPQCGGALLLHVGVRREIFKGKHIVGGKADHARGIDGAGQLASGLEQRLQAPRRPCCRPRSRSRAAWLPAPSAADRGPAPSRSIRTHACAPHPG